MGQFYIIKHGAGLNLNDAELNPFQKKRVSSVFSEEFGPAICIQGAPSLPGLINYDVRKE